MSKQKQKEVEKANLFARGYQRYLKKEFPQESGKMVCLFQASSNAPWAQTKLTKDYWEYYKKTSDIHDRSFYWKPVEA